MSAGETDIDELLEQHRMLRASLPNVWNAFFARFGQLRPIQVAAIPQIVAGHDLLLSAPTAGGKTEAVAAPICENAIRERWQGLSVLMITPTRALVNDLFQRLEAPCKEAGIVLRRKTSDHPLPEGMSVNFLITTPESTESLLTFNRNRLEDLRAILIDEVHLLDGSPRGDQLVFLLHRLRAFLRHRRGGLHSGIQFIGISATISNPSATARRYLGEGAEVVTVSGQRDVQAEIVMAPGDDEERAEAVAAGAERFTDVHKALIFVNSRKQADQAMLYQRRVFARLPIFGHHGNLSKEERERTESRFRNEPRAVCVATMTLEVGIDIGDVDLVVCLDPPFGLASFLQRIGRGCRRLQGRTRVLCIARTEADRLIFEALIQQARLGMPSVPYPPLRRSVILQQVLAYLKQVAGNRRTAEQFANAFGVANDPRLAALLTETLADMVVTGLIHYRNGVYEPASEGREFIESQRIYSNIAPMTEIELVDADTGRSVGRVSQLDPEGRGVRVAGRSFELLPGGSDGIQKVRATGDHQATPRYGSRSLPYAADVGLALAGLLGIEPHVIVAIEKDGALVLMTWLGKLLNLSVATLLSRQGIRAKARAFCIAVEPGDGTATMEAIRTAIQLPISTNPLSDQPVERAADLGPHLQFLSPQSQSLARGDFHHGDHLREWIGKVTECRIETLSDLAEKLLWLAEK